MQDKRGLTKQQHEQLMWDEMLDDYEKDQHISEYYRDRRGLPSDSTE